MITDRRTVLLLGLLAGLGACTTKEPAMNPDRSLLDASASGDADAVQAALAAGASVDARDERQRTPLLLAVTGDHVAAAQVLVAAGADANALDDQHDTPWLVTGVTGSVAMVEVLLPAKPDFSIVNRYGGISVIPASERGHVAYVKRMTELGMNVNHINNLGWTALLECVLLGDGSPPYQEIARILVDAGAEVSIGDKQGLTALDHANALGYDEIAAILH